MFHREASARRVHSARCSRASSIARCAFLAALLELPHAGAEVAQPLLALGQLDFDLAWCRGRPPAGGLPAASICRPISAEFDSISASAASMRFSLFAGLGQAAAGRRRVAAGRRATRGRATARCWSNWLRRSSAAVMATRFSARASTMRRCSAERLIDQPLLRRRSVRSSSPRSLCAASIAVSNSASCDWSARNWLRREIRPVETLRGPTVSVPSGSSSSPASVT